MIPLGDIAVLVAIYAVPGGMIAAWLVTSLRRALAVHDDTVAPPNLPVIGNRSPAPTLTWRRS